MIAIEQLVDFVEAIAQRDIDMINTDTIICRLSIHQHINQLGDILGVEATIHLEKQLDDSTASAMIRLVALLDGTWYVSIQSSGLIYLVDIDSFRKYAAFIALINGMARNLDLQLKTLFLYDDKSGTVPTSKQG